MTQIWDKLLDAQLVEGQAPQNKESIASPWYIQVLIGFSGWISALLILIFIFMTFHTLKSSIPALIIFGILMISISYTVLRKYSHSFVSQLSLALSLAGQILVFMGLEKLLGVQSTLFWLVLTLINGLLSWYMPQYFHRLSSAFLAVYTLCISLLLSGFFGFSTPLLMLLILSIWTQELYYPHQIKKLQAIGYGLVLGLIMIVSTQGLQPTLIFGHTNSLVDYFVFMPYFSEILEGIVMLGFVLFLLKAHQERTTFSLRIITILAIILLTLLSLKISGLLIGILILLLGFNHSNRILLTLGILTLLLHISSYYYLLTFTLLEKSFSLLLLSLSLLLGRWLLFYLVPKSTQKESSHA